MEKRKILIKGPKVHSVGYRAFLLDEAEALLIPNFSAKNIKNETEIVEVLVGGTKEKIDIFIKFVKNNYPEDAEVTDISVEDYDGDIRTIEAYSRSFSASQLSKIAVTGVALIKNQKEHIEITREIVQKQDEHIGITREILQKQDEHISITKEGFNNILAKQEEHINITKEGFNSVTQELKSFKDMHHEILELRQEVNELKGTVSRIEKMVEA
jgi:acylphosphatase